jgi:hypothetical protein
MATRAELQAEAYRRGVMPADQAAVYEEAVRRGVVRDDFAKGKQARGGMATFNASVPGFDEIAAGASAGISTLRGKGSFGQNWQAERNFQEGQKAGLAERNPVGANLTTGLGYALQAIPALLSGGSTAAPQAVASGGLFGGLKRGGLTAAKNATTASLYGFGNAAADKGTGTERLKAANAAILPSAAAGVIAPAVLATPRIALNSAPVRTVVRAANNTVSRVGGKGFLNPQTEAFRVIGESLKKDGFTAEQIQRAAIEWQRVGGPSPAFVDLISKGGRGQRTLSLIRGSAMTGGGKEEAVKYIDKVAADLQDSAIARTSQLASDRRTIPELQSQTERQIAANSTAPNVQPGSGGMAASDTLNARYDVARANTNNAYGAVRAANPEQAMLERSQVPQLAANVRQSVRDYDPMNIPRVSRELSTLDNLSTANARDLFDLRSRLTALRQSADPVEASAAARAVAAIDQELQGAVERGAFTGDPSVVNLAREAVGARRAQGQQFESGDMTAGLVNREFRGGGMTNTVAPEDASNFILGRNGVTPRPNMTRDLTRMRDTLGPDSPEWNALRQEARARLLGQDANGPEFGNNYLRFERDNPDLAALIMTPGERVALTGNRANIMAAQADQQAIGAGQKILTDMPDVYASNLGANTTLGANLGVAQTAGARTLEGVIGAPTEGASGVLNRISTATNPGRNLSATYGADTARDYQQSIAQMVDQVKTARYIDPNTNSQTAGRIADQSLVEGVLNFPKTPMGWAMSALEKFQRGATLNDAERQAIVEIATGRISGAAPEGIQRALAPRPPQVIPGAPAVPITAGLIYGRQENRR